MNEYGFDYMNYITNIPNKFANPNMLNQNNMMPHSEIIGNLNYMPSSPSNTPKQQKLLEPTEGLMRGNLFSNLYIPYKNYKPATLTPNSEKEALLYQILQYNFALTELNLYLDNYPNRREIIDLYNKYLAIKKQMCDKYESMYGPLTLNGNYLGTNTWNWENSPWPWEGV